MEPGFWIDRWREGRIGFHEGKPNAYLARHGERLGRGRRVLVPLCGKSADLAHLAGLGHAVVGVELVEDAVRAFFAEHGLTPQVETVGALTRYRAGSIDIVAGDLFAAGPEHLGPIDAVYDRAALIALPAATRERYARHLRALVPAGATGLLVTLEYPQERMDGPPFSVDETEVRRVHAGVTVEALDHGETDLPALRGTGVTIVERCYHLTW